MKNSFYRTAEINTRLWDVMISDLHETLEDLQAGKVQMSGLAAFISNHIALQDENGFWALVDPQEVPSDIRVLYFYIPTYISTAILIRSRLDYPMIVNEISGFDEALSKGLLASTSRSFKGHGIYDMAGVIEALTIFQKGGVKRFLKGNTVCSEFSELVRNWLSFFHKALQSGNTTAGWQEDYSEKYRSILSLYEEGDGKQLFVYGTLLKGEANHDVYLSDAKPLGQAVLNRYALYDLGSFPGICLSDSDSVKGEVYEVSDDTIRCLNRLEGEGSLYLLKKVTVANNCGDRIDAYTYVYNHEVRQEDKIPFECQPWGKYVWYASYGSNLLSERFACYIQGGICRYNGVEYPPCKDKTLPLKALPIEIPYDMYCGNVSESWHGSGVSFLDISKPGRAYGRMYLITREQFEHVHTKESKSNNWYDRVVPLGRKDGILILTITNHERKPREPISNQYYSCLLEGLCETYPEIGEGEMCDYIKSR